MSAKVNTSGNNGAASLPRSGQDWLTPGRFAVLLALMIFFPFREVLQGGQTFAVRDFGLFSYPVASYFRDSFWRGEWPLWDPLSCCGTPFLAQLNTLTLYPPSLIYLLLPLPWSLPFFCLLHLFLGGLGMYFLAARWSGSRLGGAVAGTIFAFNGLSLNFLMWPSHIATFALMPWVIWLAQDAWECGGRKIMLAALAAALQVLAGGPETILFTWLILLVLAVRAFCMGTFPVAGRAVLCPPHDVKATLIPLPMPDGGQGTARPTFLGDMLPRPVLARRFFAVGCLALGLAAAQLLPFIDLSLHSNRGNQYGDAAWSMPPCGWANLLVPLFQTSSWQQIVQQEHQHWTSSYYAGIGAIFLAVMALGRGRSWRVWLPGVLLGLSLVLALGDQGFLFTALRHFFPFLGLFRYPVEFVLIAIFALPLLAAAAIAHYENWKPLAPRWWWPEVACGGLLLVLVGLILWFARQWPAGDLPWTTVAANGLGRAGFLVLIIALVYLLVIRPSWRGWTGLALLAVCWLDVLTHEPWQNPTVNPSVYQAGLESLLKPGPVVAGQSRIMMSPYSARQMYYNASHSVATNLLLDRAVFLADCNLLDGVPKVDGFFSLYLPLEAQSSVTAQRQEEARVDVRQFAPAKIVLEVQAPAPAMITISQAWYHNWKARVDGLDVPLWRANEAFQAVQAPAGRHQITLIYRDLAFRWGGCLSVLSLITCALCWCWFGATRPFPTSVLSVPSVPSDPSAAPATSSARG